VEADAGVVIRNLKILNLGLIHPDFPSELRGLLSAAAFEMETWYEEFVRRIKPAEELITSVLFLGAPKPELRPVYAQLMN